MGIMRQEKRVKVCFIIPDTAEDTATHFLHKHELIRELERDVEFAVCEPSFWGMAKIKFAYVFRGYRIFYVHYSFKGALFAIILTKLFGGKVFYWNCGMPWLYRRGWFEERLFRFILRQTIFVTGTETLADEYAKRYGLDKKNIRVVPNYIQISRFQQISRGDARNELKLPPDKKIVLFLHRLSRRKGAHLLPEIIKEFQGQNDILFLIAGDGPERKDLELLTTHYSLQTLTRFVGSVPNFRIPEYIVAADVYVMPSEEEGMPNALLEAMAAGVPFVASDVGAVKEMTPSCMHEFVLTYGNVAMFAEKIKKLLRNEELRKKLAKEEQEWVCQFDVSIIAPQFFEMIQKR